MKRYFVLLLSVLMVLGTACFPAGVSAEGMPAMKSVMKFDEEKISKWKNVEKGNYTEEDGSAVTALKMAPGALKSDGTRGSKWCDSAYWFDEHGIDTDMSDYQTINFRMYSAKATNEKMNIIFEGKKGWLGDWLRATITIDWEGWKDVPVHFRDCTIIGNGSEGQIFSIWFNFGDYGIGGTGNAETEIAVTEIYLSNLWNDIHLADSLIVYKFDSAEKCTAAQIASDTALTNMYDISAKIVTTDGTNDVFVTPNRYLKVDTQKYQRLNLLMYSSKATAAGGKGMNITIHDNSKYVRKVLPINWDTGWKVVSIPLSEFEGGPVDWNAIKSVKMNAGGWSVPRIDAGTELHFDMIWFSKEDPKMVLEETITQAGSTEMPAVGAAVSFRFNNPLRAIDETKLTFTKQGETDEEALSCTVAENTVTLAAQNELEYKTAYTLTAQPGAIIDVLGQSNQEVITYDFTTLEQGLNASLPVLTDDTGEALDSMPENEGIIKASTKVNNGLLEEKNATLVLAFYDAENRLVKCETESKTFAANSVDTIEMTATAAGTTVKAFVVDNLAALGPLYNGFSQVPAPVQSGGTQGGDTQNERLVLNTPDLAEDELVLSGKMDGALPRMVILAVAEAGKDNLTFLMPVMVDENRGFSVKTLMPAAATTGQYFVKATARRMDAQQTEPVWFIARAERESLRTTMNEAGDEKAVENLLTANREKLGLPADSIGHIAATAYEQKPYADYPAFTAILQQSQTVLAELNAAVWSGYDELFSKYPMILNGIGEEAYYFGLSAERKAIIGQKVIQAAPFQNFKAFRDVLIPAVAEDIKNNNNQNNGNTGNIGGGRGGRGGSSGSAVSLPSAMIPQAPGTGNTEPAQPTQPAEPAKPQERFGDLTEAEWARESVERLYAAGAIASAEQFRPNDSITREEFVKLMAAALGLENSAAPAEFPDVDPNAWYAPYVAAVRSAGIVTGYEDGRFGIGDQITRQDMAAILYRALEHMGKALTDTNSNSFADDGEISGYARNAVYAMRQAGIINGLEDGSFGPAQNASRAQAAKMLCGLLDQVKK